MSNGMIHIQRSSREFARDVNKSQVSIFYIFYHTVEGDGKWKINSVYLIPLKQSCLERSDRSNVQKSPSVEHRC